MIQSLTLQKKMLQECGVQHLSLSSWWWTTQTRVWCNEIISFGPRSDCLFYCNVPHRKYWLTLQLCWTTKSTFHNRSVRKIEHLELFSWKTTSQKDHLEVCLPNSRHLSGLIGMLPSIKIILIENAKILYTPIGQEMRVNLSSTFHNGRSNSKQPTPN